MDIKDEGKNMEQGMKVGMAEDASYAALAACYDRLMEDMPYDRWLEWVRSSWTQYGKPEVIVDLGCGTGTLTTMLARSGARVYGVDLSEDMLAIAENKTREVQFLQQDMRQLVLPEAADAIYSLCDSMNYLPEMTDLRTVMTAVYRQLTAGGVFLFDLLSEQQFIEYAAQQPFVLDEPDLAYIWHCEYDDSRKQIEHELSLFVSDDEGCTFRRMTEYHRQTAYAPEQVLAELRRAGFSHVFCTADFTHHPPDASSSRLFFTAVKSP